MQKKVLQYMLRLFLLDFQNTNWEMVLKVADIDSSRVDCSYKASTCDVMYSIVDSVAIYYIMAVKFRNTICPPPPQLSLHRRATLSSNSKGTPQSLYSRNNLKGREMWDVFGCGISFLCKKSCLQFLPVECPCKKENLACINNANFILS
jgi:hypothetical protein